MKVIEPARFHAATALIQKDDRRITADDADPRRTHPLRQLKRFNTDPPGVSESLQFRISAESQAADQRSWFCRFRRFHRVCAAFAQRLPGPVPANRIKRRPSAPGANERHKQFFTVTGAEPDRIRQT
jgi:hypothetical protein